MYFKGTLTVDPQQISNIEVIKPEGGFRQLFYSITGGKVGDKKEVETNPETSARSVAALQDRNGVTTTW